MSFGIYILGYVIFIVGMAIGALLSAIKSCASATLLAPYALPAFAGTWPSSGR
jgi:hypothetical protein